MSFQGNKYLSQELPINADFSRAYVVLVSGNVPNICGHALIYFPGGFGHYFHFTGPEITDHPRYLLGQNDYQRYLKENNKREFYRVCLSVPNPEGAKEKLRALLNKEWTTYLVAHNCVSFINEILKAGGVSWSFLTYCPTPALLHKIVWDMLGSAITKNQGAYCPK